MTIEELNELLADGSDIPKIIDAVKKLRPSYGKSIAGNDLSYEDIYKQYDPTGHDVVSASKRPDKKIKTEGEDGNPKDETVKVARLPIPYQKLIVKRRATFLCGNPIVLDASPEKDTIEASYLEVIQKIWDDNKLDYKSKQLAKLMFSETECAELWFSEEAQEGYWEGTKLTSKFRLRVLILANSLGDTLYPVYDPTGDMIAFGRGYSLKVGDKKEEHLDLYTADTRYMYVKSEGGAGWAVTKEDNPFKKIPVIFYKQAAPEWRDVQPIIDRREVVTSNRGDTNDYFGSPMVVVKGEIKSFAKKGESGAVLQLESVNDSVEYLTWTQSPESVSNETKDLDDIIHIHTGMPKLSEEQVKGLGNYSAVALKMLFLPAHMEAADKEEIFGECVQRRINLLKSTVVLLDSSFKKAAILSIKPKFEYYLPKNDSEKIDTLVNAVTGGIMSVESAVRQNPLIEDVQAEVDAVKADAEAKRGSLGLDNIMNQ